MFDTLTGRFEAVFSKLRGRGRLSASDVDAALGEIRAALLEADVNLDVVASLTARIRARAVDEELSRALNPAQQVVKIVLSELTASLGGERLVITYAPKPPTVVLLAGLQGSGKTTNAAKLARWFQRQGRNPLLVGADLQRPAAVEQLRTLGGRIGVPVFSEPTDPVRVAAAALAEASRTGRDVVIVDTAGRLAVDAEMMQQARLISGAVRPHLTFLVVDAMTGQDAASTAKTFHDALALDGVILTKLDGDARGGAALSVKRGGGPAHRLRFGSARSWRTSSRSIPTVSPAGSWAWAMWRRSSTRPNPRSRPTRQKQTASRLLEGTFTFDDFLSTMQQVLKMGNLAQPARHDARRAAGAARTRDIDDSRIRPHHRHDPLDDAGGARQIPTSSTPPAASASRPARAAVPPRSRRWSSSSSRCEP